MRKKCTRCGKVKPYPEFRKRSDSKTGRTSMCTSCSRSYDRRHYATSPERRARVKQNRSNAKRRAQQFICEYLRTHPCIDCGESDPVVLEFDHVRGKKLGSISKLRTISKNVVKREMKKCVVRCANCHRRKTAKQFNWPSKMPP